MKSSWFDLTSCLPITLYHAAACHVSYFIHKNEHISKYCKKNYTHMCVIQTFTNGIYLLVVWIFIQKIKIEKRISGKQTKNHPVEVLIHSFIHSLDCVSIQTNRHKCQHTQFGLFSIYVIFFLSTLSSLTSLCFFL